MRLHTIVVRFSVLIIASSGLSLSQTTPANTNGPTISLNNLYALPTQYVGPSGITQYLAGSQAQPVSLAHADFDSDGIEDLVIGYRAPGRGGILALQPGNVDTFAPQSQASWNMMVNNQFIAPFVNTAKVFSIPAAPNFLVTGQFLGQVDLVTAAQGGNGIYILAGDGKGNFAAPQAFSVSGPINAMASGRFGSDNETNSLLIATGGPQPLLLLYRRSNSGLTLVASYGLQAPASSLDIDDLDGDGYPDGVMVSNGEVMILHAVGSNGAPQLETLALPFSAVGVIPGFFTHDRCWRRQMAVLDTNSMIHIVVHGNFDPRPWTSAEIAEMRDALIHGLPNPFQPTGPIPATDGWTVLESFSGLAPFSGTAQAPLLFRTSFLGRGANEVLAINSGAGQAGFVSHTAVQPGATSFVPGQQSLLSLSSTPTAAVVMPVSASQSGLVMLTANSTTPVIAATTTTIAFTVNTTADTVHKTTYDGVCADSTNHCSLRAAVMEVNAEAANGTVGPFQINVPAGNFNLTIPGAATTDASTGHLDVKAPVTIIGTGPKGTTITQTNPITPTHPNGDQDLVFLVDAPEENVPAYNITIRGMTITGGHASSYNLVPEGGAIHWEAGVDGTGGLSLLNLAIQGNFATDTTDPGEDVGGGIALFNTAKPTKPAVVSISGSNTVIQNNTAYDAGGGIALRGAVSLKMTGVPVTGNQAENQVAGAFSMGGGLYLSASGNPTSSPSSIHGCTISGNTVGGSSSGEGGGIWTDQPLTINQGSLITSNDVEGVGGGIATYLQGTGSITITASTISGNASTENGGGIEVGAGTSAKLNLSFNRIFGNTVGSGAAGTGLSNASSGTVSAADNWWGCNGGPQSSGNGCDQVLGAATASPFVTLGLSANPNPVPNLSSSTLTAAFQDSNSTFSSNLNAWISLPICFSNAVNGTLSNGCTVTNSTATATDTFTVSSGPNAQANVQVDNAVVTATMQVSDFSLSSSPPTQTVNVGTGTVTYQIMVAAINGFGGAVTLSVSNASGLTTNLSATSVTGSGSVTLTAQTGSAAPGTYSITITGTSGSISHQLTVQLSIADFAVSISPASQAVTLGSKAVYTVTVSSSTGFNGTITLSASGLPAGTVVFGGSILNLSGSTTSASSTLTLTLSATGTYSFSVIASSAQNNSQTSVSRSASGTLVVNPPPPPDISAPNISLSVFIHPGSANTTVITGNTIYEPLTNNSTYPVGIGWSSVGLFSGGSCVAAANSYCTAQGTFYANANTPSGTYTVTLTLTGTAQPPGSGTTSIKVTATAIVTNTCDPVHCT